MRVSLGLAASIAALGMVVAPTAAFAAVDAYLYIDGIDGASKDAAHQHWIEVSSWSFGKSNPTTIGSATGGAGAGKTRFNEFTIRKTTDSASPKLRQAAASGRHFAEVKLEMRKAGGQGYTTYDMHDVMISGANISGGGDNPMESLTFTFARVDTSSQGQDNLARPGPVRPR